MGTEVSALFEQAQLEGSFCGREASIFHVMGKRTQFNAAFTLYDVNEFMAAATQSFTELVGTETWEILSSSANDTAAGTGTRTVDITYLSAADYSIQVKSVTMNGVTPVAVTAFDPVFIYGMEAATGGSSEDTVGNIILRIPGPGATHEQISAGGNKSLSGKFMVPDGYVALIPDWDTHCVGQAMDFRLQATMKSTTHAIGTRYICQDTALMAANTNAEHQLFLRRFPARAKIKAAVAPQSVAGTPRADISFPVILLKG